MRYGRNVSCAPRCRIERVVIARSKLSRDEIQELHCHTCRCSLFVMIIDPLNHLVPVAHNVHDRRCNITPLLLRFALADSDGHTKALLWIERPRSDREVSLETGVKSTFHSDVLPVSRQDPKS